MKPSKQKRLMALGKRSIELMEPFVNESMITRQRLKDGITQCKAQPKVKRAICKKLLRNASNRKSKVNYTTNKGLAAFRSMSTQMWFAPSCTKIWPLQLEASMIPVDDKQFCYQVK